MRSSLGDQEEVGEDGGHKASESDAAGRGGPEGVGVACRVPAQVLLGGAAAQETRRGDDAPAAVGVGAHGRPSATLDEERRTDRVRASTEHLRSKLKRKSSATNASKPPIEKWRKIRHSQATTSCFVNETLGRRSSVMEDNEVEEADGDEALNQNLGYLCITCHFIDNDWTLQKRIIGFGLVASPHDGFTLLTALLKCLQEWKLEHKLFSITMDNAKNNNKMAGFLKKNLLERHLMLGKGDLLHMRCIAHVLNLIVQEGFKVISRATDHNRESVKYIRSSQARKQRFEEIIVQVGISCEKRPTLDVPTRWNSTYLMLKSAKEYKTAFDALDSQDPNYMDRPSNADWNMADLLCDVFKPFYDATNVISGTEAD